jgi:hypothetical protein
MLVVPFLLLLAVSMLYTNFVQRQADQRWCALVVSVDDAYLATPPQTPVGEQIAEAMHQLRQELDC